MALTSVVINSLAPIPSTIAFQAVGTGAGTGFAFTLSDLATMPKVLSITGDADFFLSSSSTAAAAVGSAVRVRADQPYRLQVHTPVNVYLRTATGTSNVWVTVEL